jgi:hypothetical protein
MALPRVFISSTCYDFKDIREYLKEVIESIGYIPVLSDVGDVYYDAKENVQDACLIEVETCQDVTVADTKIQINQSQIWNIKRL